MVNGVFWLSVRRSHKWQLHLKYGLNTADSDWQETDPTSRHRGRPTETTQQLSDRKYVISGHSARAILAARHTDYWPAVVAWLWLWLSYTRIICAGDARQKLKITDPTSRQRGSPTSTNTNCQRNNQRENGKNLSRVPDGCPTTRQTSRMNNWESSGFGLENREYGRSGSAAKTTRHPCIRKKVGINTAEKRWSLGWYSSLAD
jgi:hypothetical protein